MVRGSKNPMLGSFDGLQYKDGSLQMEPGDTLVMYTDGVTEAMNASHEELGPERFGQILQNARDMGSQEIVKAVKTGIADFVGDARQSDDITMLVIKRK
jgi:sigma-B regulation protein RsbU (phosphoserine phosphatase)